MSTERHRPFALVLGIALAFVACGAQEPILNSERIERSFGSYGVDVLRADAEGRVSSLYSGTGDARVTRTFAVVMFSGPVRRAYASEHALVQSGRSLGEVFKSAGWEIDKLHIFIGEMEIPAEYRLLSDLMQIDLPMSLATHVYELTIRRDGGTYDYAMIVEIHHPDYLSADDLQAIYGEIIFDDSERTGVDDYIDPQIWNCETGDIGRPAQCQ